MTNVEHKIEGNKLILTIDISKDKIAEAGPSKSGKTKLVATTNGFANLGPVGVSMNVTAR